MSINPIEAFPITPRTSQQYCTEEFEEWPQLGSHYVEKYQPYGRLMIKFQTLYNASSYIEFIDSTGFNYIMFVHNI